MHTPPHTHVNTPRCLWRNIRYRELERLLFEVAPAETLLALNSRREDKTKYPDSKHQQASIQLAFAYFFLLTVYRRQAQKLKKIDLNANICRFKRQKNQNYKYTNLSDERTNIINVLISDIGYQQPQSVTFHGLDGICLQKW